ncbi:MAG: biliverdin-producing heme oxygenase [Caulobacteraceae bacterium]
MADAAHRLREGTASSHASVDKAFSAFDMTARDGYGGFLLAMGRVLPGAERAVEGLVEARADGLFSDLEALGLARPHSVAFSPMTGAAAWGAAYVLEGSRLGAKVLERRVSADLPRTFLSQGHAGGGWAAFRARLNQAADGEAWIMAALASARDVFAAFEAAAAREEIMYDR